MISWGIVAALTGLVHTALQFYSARFLLGLAEAGFFPGLLVYLTHWYRDEDRGKAIGMFMSATAVASTVGAPLSGLLMRIHWFGLSGWRWLLILEGAPAIILGIATLFYLTDRPKDAAWLPAEEKEWIDWELERERKAREKVKTVKVWTGVGHPYVILLTTIYFLGNAAQYGFSLWLPKLIQNISGLSSFQVALVASIPFLVSCPVMLLVGWSSDRTRERRWHTAIAYIVTAAGLAGSSWAGNRIFAGMAMFRIVAAGLNSRLPAFWALPHSFLGGTAAAASIGVINCIGGLGGFFGPYILGAFSTSRGSYASGIWCLSGASLLAAILVLLLRGSAQKVRRNQHY